MSDSSRSEAEIYGRLVERFLSRTPESDGVSDEVNALPPWPRAPALRIVHDGGRPDDVLARLVSQLSLWSDSDVGLDFLTYLRSVYLALENPIEEVKEVRNLWNGKSAFPGYDKFIYLFMIRIRENLALPRDEKLDIDVRDCAKRTREMILAIFRAIGP